MQTPCGKLECAVCITTLLSKSDIDSFSCTSCKEVHIIDASYPAASDVLLKILGELLLTCDSPSCSTLVALKNLKEHVMSGCKLTTPTFSPSKLTIQQITSCPLTSPPTNAERRVATNVVKRLMCSSTSHVASIPGIAPVVKLPTAGQVRQIYIQVHVHVYTKHTIATCILHCLTFKPLQLVKVTAPRVGSSEASSKTVRNRSNQVHSYRDTLTGSEGSHQLLDEMKVLSQKERDHLLSVFSTPTCISAEDLLALKAVLMIPWTKLREMRRYMVYNMCTCT